MVKKAKAWSIIQASPKIQLTQQHAQDCVMDAELEAKFLPFCNQPLRVVLMIMRNSGMRDQKEICRTMLSGEQSI